VVGGTLGAVKERGFTDDFAASLLLGAAIGAVAGFGVGVAGPGAAETWTPTIQNLLGVFGKTVAATVVEHALAFIILAIGTPIVAAAAVAAANCSPLGRGACVLKDINPFFKEDPDKRSLASSASALSLNTQPMVP